VAKKKIVRPGYPSPLGVFWEQILLFEWFAGEWCLQNIQIKGVAYKILVFKEMPAAGEAKEARVGNAALSFLTLYSV
jgi:hypothetical protein